MSTPGAPSTAFRHARLVGKVFSFFPLIVSQHRTPRTVARGGTTVTRRCTRVGETVKSASKGMASAYLSPYEILTYPSSLRVQSRGFDAPVSCRTSATKIMTRSYNACQQVFVSAHLVPSKYMEKLIAVSNAESALPR